jgi:hypothetical protein
VREYLRKTEWVLDDASFAYLGGRYRGRGLLTWQPDAGFHLEAFVTRSGPPMPDRVQFWQVRLATRQDRTSLRMRIQHGGRAFAVVTLADRFDVVAQKRLSCTLGAVHLMTPLPEVARSAKRWSGSVLIEVGSSVLWPDRIVRTVQLEGQTIGESFSRDGLLHETPTLSVRGQEDDGRLDLHWSMDKTAYRRADAWRWARAFHDALSIELGCFLPLLEREVLAFPSQHIERIKAGRVVALHPFQPFEGDLVDKSRLFSLTDFFMKDTREAHICRKLFDQMVRANQQARWDDTELILSTALEGALRALDGVPSSDRRWKLDRALKRFRDKHLSPTWRRACTCVLAAFKHLRHSTAHPDWILDKMAQSADAERSASFDDLRFLSRFYGYMILALAGVQHLQPVFDGQSLDPQSPASDPQSSSPEGSSGSAVGRRRACPRGHGT